MTSRTSRTTSDGSIAEVLDRFREELAVIRQVLDDIASELQWASRNREPSGDSDRSFRRVASMPLDPTVPHWAERLNQFSAGELSSVREPPSPNQPGRLF